MPTPQKMVDIDGNEVVSRILTALLNQFPGLGGKEILFSSLNETNGIGLFPTSGSVLESNNEDVIGNVTQICLYPFNIIYRSAPRSEEQKVKIKEFLDALGRWLERQPVLIDGVEYQLDSYPTITVGTREIKSINRTMPSHLQTAYQDGIEDWALSATLRYENKFII